MDWAEYFQGAGLSRVESFIVWQPEAFQGESALVATRTFLVRRRGRDLGGAFCRVSMLKRERYL